ncbi:MAG: DUF2752 domain-containing protein [Flavobacteriales bacterium]
MNWLSENLLTCPFKACTGMDCPGCGLQRSLIKLLEGDIPGSIEMHPAGMLYPALLIMTGLHLRFQFKNGSKIITWTFILTVTITLINYIIKLYTGNVFE